MFLSIVLNNDSHLRDFEVQVILAAELEIVVSKLDVLELSIQVWN